MSHHQLYGHSFQIEDRYAEGHALTKDEAEALNTLRGERISHMLRSAIVKRRKEANIDTGVAIVEGDPDHAILVAKLPELASTYEFTSRGESMARRTPVEQEAIELAREAVKRKVAEAGLRVGKRAKGDDPEEKGDGIYPYSRYCELVEEVAAYEDTIKEAKAIVKRREASKEKGIGSGITL